MPTRPAASGVHEQAAGRPGTATLPLGSLGGSTPTPSGAPAPPAPGPQVAAAPRAAQDVPRAGTDPAPVAGGGPSPGAAVALAPLSVARPGVPALLVAGAALLAGLIGATDVYELRRRLQAR